MVGFRSLANLWERLPVLEVTFLDGGRRPGEAAMISSFKQPAYNRVARKAAIDGMGRALRELWKDEPAAPIPERFSRLLAQLEQRQRNASSASASKGT
jgi:hypothetical protein